MQRHVPNLITGSRLVLAAAFFVLLSFYQYQGKAAPLSILLLTAFVIYVAALVSDYLDGYLARKWHVEGAFGRVVDPFADKILTLGTFIFFAGKNFIIPELSEDQEANRLWVKTITGVAPWMVVVMLSRELLVTSLRGLAESGGQSFGAVWAGKFKMGFQSASVLIILTYVTFRPWLLGHGHTTLELLARIVRDISIWGTIVITLYSGITYVQKAAALFRQSGAAATGSGGDGGGEKRAA